jgi:predicted peptidase
MNSEFFRRTPGSSRLAFATVLLLSALALAAAAPNAAALETGFLNRTVKADGQSMPYVVYVPRDYSAKKRWPVVLFLHGAGERGDNGLAQSQVGIGTALRMNPERFPCLVVMPQAPSRGGWRGPSNELALKALEEVVRKYRGDRERLYLTGLSMGGYGTWAIAAAHPDMFAAIMPICGGGDPAAMASALKSLPIWVFHGDADTAVPPERSRDMVKAITDAGSTRIKYTEYPGVGHNSWDRAYSDAEAMSWLFAQKRRSPDSSNGNP